MRVIDCGCGNGELLKALIKEKSVKATASNNHSKNACQR